MIKILAALGLTLLATSPSLAESRCNQVRHAAATYGYTMVRQYTLTHYGEGAARYADRCLMKTKHRHHARRV